MTNVSAPCTGATLLVFGLTPAGDCERRPLLPGRLRRLERALRERCLERILDAGREAGFDIELSTPGERRAPTVAARPDVRRSPQPGATFGERVRGALRGAWSHNPEGPVVLVGTDTPELSADHLRRAVALAAGDPDAVVVGPSADGGFYLAASARPFDDALARVRWCGAHARADLVTALAAGGRTVILLAPLADLDRPSDLLALLKDGDPAFLARPLARRLLGVLRALARPLAAPESAHLLADLAAVRVLRGPPALLPR
jgi:glycosyltransferase A (GT-A) superfamily protein (DUF2064 family)